VIKEKIVRKFLLLGDILCSLLYQHWKFEVRSFVLKQKDLDHRCIVWPIDSTVSPEHYITKT